MANGEEEQISSEKVWDVLRRSGPRLINTLMRFANTKKQAAFARKTGLTANQINRYIHGKEFPDQNLSRLTAKLGLTEDNTWWLIGRTVAEEYGYARFEVPPPPADEVREPNSPYRLGQDAARDLPEDTAMIMALDLNRLAPEDRVLFTQERNALRDQAEAHQTLVEKYVERYKAALRRPHP